MATLTPNDILNLVAKAAKAAGTLTSTPGTSGALSGTVTLGPGSFNDATMVNGVKLGSNPAFRHGQISTQTIKATEWLDRQTFAAAIIYAESGGVTNNRCYNVDDANGNPTCRKTPPAGPRGVDRGLWQWNSVAWPTITDTAADDPASATILAFLVSNGFSDFGPWKKSKGMDPNSEPFKVIAKAMEDQMGYVVDKGLFGIPGEAAFYDTITGALSGALDWATGLAKLLSTLVSVSFWKRVGMGAAGLGLLIFAIVLFSGNTVRSSVRKVTP